MVYIYLFIIYIYHLLKTNVVNVTMCGIWVKSRWQLFVLILHLFHLIIHQGFLEDFLYD